MGCAIHTVSYVWGNITNAAMGTVLNKISKSKVTISRTPVKKVKMGMGKFHVSLIKDLSSFFGLICLENMKHLSFIIFKQRAGQDFYGKGDIKL